MTPPKKTSWNPIWENIFLAQNWGKYPEESLIQFIARNFYETDRRGIRILEIGCGPGANIWYLSRENFNVYGIDRNKTAINIAKRRIEEDHNSATLHSWRYNFASI
jgi:2-polyprenyl-3-methyl-5-hydroxy-6-metoxy-1,4-benzoquinol methylase